MFWRLNFFHHLVSGIAWLAFGVVGFGLHALPPVPRPVLVNDDELLETLQRRAFDFFWREANPSNGLIPDRTRADSKCSIAAVGFGLSALVIGVDHGWISPEEARKRAQLTLQTFAEGPQGVATEGVIGYRGWYYHFLELDSARRAWKCELSSIDTALFLAGVLDVARFFESPNPSEATEIQLLANRIVRRVDWEWMRNGGETFTMGWHPERGFIATRWQGYNEAMILYLLALGAPEHPLPASAWTAWTQSYSWQTNYGQAYLEFPPLFGHQYSHCWVDFRGIADPWMRSHGLDYFENSRRATLAQHAYAIANPFRHSEYGNHLWGFTACDGPDGYSARGAPPPEHDDGTIAPTAVGGSLPFAPEICLPTLREFHNRWGGELWTQYGFRDAFNVRSNWFAPDVLGIDQGPILLMIENYRTGRVWGRMRESPQVRRGLAAAGFSP